MSHNGGGLLIGVLGCLLLLHSPDGEQLWIRSDAIQAIKPVGAHQDHVVKNTRSIIYDGKPRGLRETAETIINMIKNCETNTSRP